ncbi:uncharacterized protein LOC136084956 [Hydra vulgaris]|uniref:Uncharacterized protein LOC136084956 n=1 Tax=Hydra vulgaris TaxID=6087 RepID=A0ABM4CKX9_HYDVU
MPKRKVLTDIEKGQILAYHREEVPNREIARRLKRSDHVIRNFLKNPTDYATIKRKPKKSKVSGREKRRIVLLSSSSSKSLKTIKSDLGLNVCKETIRKVLKDSPHIVRSKMNKALNLKPVHKQKRMEFAHKNMVRD